MEPTTQKSFDHYYGDFVRVIFIAAAVFVLWGLPRITEIFDVSVVFPILTVVILGGAAGYTNPVKIRSLQLNVIVSGAFLVIFSYLAWYSYANNLGNVIEFSNQVGAVLFLFASYFSIKSFRGAMVRE